jgi:hypothetical protein
MFTLEKEKSYNSKCNAHVANRYSMMEVAQQGDSGESIWPLSSKFDQTEKFNFPESWSGF